MEGKNQALKALKALKSRQVLKGERGRSVMCMDRVFECRVRQKWEIKYKANLFFFKRRKGHREPSLFKKTKKARGGGKKRKSTKRQDLFPQLSVHPKKKKKN